MLFFGFDLKGGVEEDRRGGSSWEQGLSRDG